MTTFTDSVLVSFADWDKLGSIPRWARGFNTQRNTVAEISKAEDLPEIIVLKAPSANIHGAQQRQIHNFVERLEHSTQPFKLVLSFATKKSANLENMVEVLRLFSSDLRPNIEISSNIETLEESLNEAFAKFLLVETESGRDPLANARNVVAAVRPLLAASGRLSAKAIAEKFGMSVAQLARQIGQSRQALSKTPDAPGIQMFLRPYERIFRLRTVFSNRNFHAWLERPNRELDDASPMELLNESHADIIADLVEDMLLGTPA